MKAGIAPELLVSQVKNTAGWLWSDPRASAATRVLDISADHFAARFERRYRTELDGAWPARARGAR